MKVLLSAYACEPNRGSEEGFGWNWSTHLAKEGHQVWVMTRPHTRLKIEEELTRNPIPNLNFIYIDVPSKYKKFLKGLFGVYAHYFIWQRTILDYALDFVERQPVDVVHHVTWGSLIGGSRLWKLGIPFVFGPVGGGQVAPQSLKSYFYKNWRQESIRTFTTEHILPRNPLTRKMLKHTALLLATNSDTYAIAEQMGAPNTKLFLDTGLPEHYYAESPKQTFTNDVMNILWVGRLLERKALKLSLDAVSKLSIPFRMTILGNGPQDENVPLWIKELNLEDRVFWKGRVPWAEVQKALREHEVFLFNSLRDSFGSQLLEAMSNGLAIVTLDHHGAHDFVPPQAGIRVPIGSPEDTATSLAHALTQLQQNPELIKTMSRAALEFSRRNKWTVKANQITKLYETVLNASEEHSSL